MYCWTRWIELPIAKEEKNSFPYLQMLSEVMDSLKIPITELFWDENDFGYKPEKYAVYYITNEREELSSDDDTECECINLTVSFYIKGNFRKIKRAALNEFIAAGFFVSTGYETYERDTKYNHFDFDLKYFI